MLGVAAFLAVLSFGIALGDSNSRVLVPMLDGRIVGGSDADITDHPWQISLQRSNSHYCGGAIISPDWILTAAHCVESALVSVFSVRAGSSLHNTGGVIIPAAYIAMHELYSRSTIDYDIAVVRLASSLTYNEAIQPIPLPPAGSGPVAGAIATVTGWGDLVEGGQAGSIRLQVVEVPIVSQAVCRAAYSTTSVTDRMFCAGLLDVGGKDACQGDSGGPVIVGDQLAGLVSWGNGCARPGYPGVKTNVINLREWVRENTGI